MVSGFGVWHSISQVLTCATMSKFVIVISVFGGFFDGLLLQLPRTVAKVGFWILSGLN